MTDVPNGSGNVSYTVKELLARIEGKVDDVLTVVGHKADKSEVDTLAGRVQSLEIVGSAHAQQNAKKIEQNDARLDELERQQSAVGGLSAFIWKTIPVLIAAAAVAVSIILKFN